jgi:hypothetical protein
MWTLIPLAGVLALLACVIVGFLAAWLDDP